MKLAGLIPVNYSLSHSLAFKFIELVHDEMKMPSACHLAGKNVPTFRDASSVVHVDVNPRACPSPDVLIVFA